MQFIVKFAGREAGAIGRVCSHTERVEHATFDRDAIRAALYCGATESGKAYEHIGQVHIEQQ